MKKFACIPSISGCLISLLLVMVICPSNASAERSPLSKSDPGRLFTELMKPYRNMSDYTVTISAIIKMQGMKIPDFKAILYFKKPDKFHVETRSFAPIPRNSGNFNPFLFDPQKNRISYERSEKLSGVKTEVYRVEPVQGETRIHHYFVWVGAGLRRIMQIESYSVKGSRALVKPTYRTFKTGNEELLLPDKVHVHIKFPENIRSSESSTAPSRDNPFARGMASPDELPGEGDVYISYRDWKINTGLDDNIFSKNEK